MACSPAGKYSPAPAPRSTWAATTRAKPDGDSGDDAAGGRRRESGEHQRPRAEAPDDGTADEVGGGDRQGQQTEGHPRLSLGHPELGDDLWHHGRQRLLADRDPQVGEADERERPPPGPLIAFSGHAILCRRGRWPLLGWRRVARVGRHLGYCMQSVLHLDDRTIADLVDPVAAERAVDDAFAAWGRGAAATTQRVRASGAGGGMASAMAAIVPPYCGGKLYATHAGRFTFLNVLFDIEGELLATLDGDAVTLLRTAAVSSLAIRHLAAPNASVATVIGTGHQAWPHVEMLLRTLPQLAELRICGRTPSAVDVLAGRVQADGVSTVTLTRRRCSRSTVPRSSSR